MQISVAYFILRIIIISNFSHASNKGLNGIHLKITAYSNPPYDALKLNPNGSYTASGISTIVYDWLSKKFNFSYSIVDPIVDKDLTANYSIYELAFAKIINKKEVDGLLGSVAIVPDRATRMDFTSITWAEPYTLVARKPGQQSRLFAFIRPFQPMAWLFLLISVTLIITLMGCFSLNFLEKRHNIISKKAINSQHLQTSKLERLINTVGFYSIYATNILTNHGMYTPFPQHSFRILAASWLLAALVLVNCYSSIVVSSLTVPVMESAINSFEDLASSKDVSIILHKNIILSQLILNATSGTLKKLGDQARRNPNQQLHLNYLSLMENLETGHFAYPFIQSFNRNFVVQQYKKDGKCRFQSSPPLPTGLSTGYFCIVLQKNFPYTSMLSHGIIQLWETGLSLHWLKHDLPNVYECFDQNQKPRASIGKVVPIKLGDLISAFLILGIGMGLGLLVFSVEFTMKYICKL